jgi:hypothetical protein
MGLFYKVTIDGVESLLHLYSGNDRTTGIDTSKQYTITSVYVDVPNFDHTLTYICGTQTTYDNLITLGFTNVIFRDNLDNKKIIFEDGKYLLVFNGGSRCYMYNADDTLYYNGYLDFGSGSDTATALYAVTDDYNDYFYYPGITAIRSNYFKLLNSYPSRGGAYAASIAWGQFINSITPFNPPQDPYAGGGTSNTGGGTGTFDGTTDAVDFPSGTPTAGAGSSGFIKLFNPSAQNLSDLAAYLWGTYDIGSFKSIYNNPIDCIVALVVVPVTPTTGSAAAISLGNVATTVNANVITDQFAVLDCGSININEYWGAYLDYDPYTKCEIYLPYIGVQDIDINDIQGKTIQLKYYIDVLSGACVAMLKAGDDVLYNWSGQCAAEIPITSTSFGSVFQTALSAANAIGETIVNAMSGIPQTLSLVASSVFNGARSKLHKSGSIGSMAGHMGIQKPYLIITRPVQSVPETLNEITGYPSNITATLGDLSGYTEIDTIHLSGIPATSEEMTEIEELLKGGVFI